MYNNRFIPCIKWIQRGAAKCHPEVLRISKKDLKKLIGKAQSDILDVAESFKNSGGHPQEPKEQNDSDYNKHMVEDNDKEDHVQSSLGIGNILSLDDEMLDPDIQMDDEDDDSEKEDDEIKPTDNLIAVGHVDGDISIMDVYVFNEQADDLYVHHDIVLPTIPLAFEWLSSLPSQSNKGNLLVMGGMSPEILIWDLDVVNCLEPVMKLGEYSGLKKHRHRNHGHTDAVLDLAWNTGLPYMLASGSVDCSVLLWDLGKARAVSAFKSFKGKVQTLEWHPSEVNLLIAGGCDSKVRLLDCRIGKKLGLFKVDGEVEKVAWHPSSPFSALVGTSNGLLCCVDIRTNELLWKVQAHDKEVSGMDVQPEGVVTCSPDETVKLWRLGPDGEPALRFTKSTNQGELQCLQVCPENPNIVCVGGNSRSDNFKLYNLATETSKDKLVSSEISVFGGDT